ncbi:MAG TPA: YitT family protein [Chitinophagaceae bacterium]|nr:YitT family protein [Chitinophagaceae bacterium]
MHSYIRQLIINAVRKSKMKKSPGQENYSSFEIAKGFVELKVTINSLLRDVIFMGLGIFSAAFGLEGFLLPNNFIDGGATGISLLTSESVAIPLSILLVVINIPFVILGFKVVGKQFAVKTAVAISCLALVVATIHFPVVTRDKVLAAVFGGFFLGSGIGLSVRGGAVIDGTEVLAIFLSRKFSATIGDIIILINILVFSAAAYLLSVETALYSMITYLAASKALDFVVEGIEEYTGVTIISSHDEEIGEMIINELGRGVTVYRGKRGFGKHGKTTDTDIVYTVITRLELNRLKTEIEKIDPHAFVIMSSVKDTHGGMIKKRPLKH